MDFDARCLVSTFLLFSFQLDALDSGFLYFGILAPMLSIRRTLTFGILMATDG